MKKRARLERLSSAAMAMRQAVLGTTAITPLEVRRAAFDGSPMAPVLAEYVELVRQHPRRVTPAQLSALRETGMSEDGIFELTVAAALGAAHRRLQAGLSLLETNGSRDATA